MRSSIIRSGSLLVLSTALSCGCSSEPNRSTNTANDADIPPAADPAAPTPTTEANVASTSKDPAAPAATTPAATRLTGGQVALVTELVNTAEIEQGKLAESKANAAKVKKFGAMMVKHHTAAKAEQAKLYKELNLTPSASPQGNLLKGDADKIIGELRAANGDAFDVAYMNSQVDAHLKVLEMIYNELLPAASDEKLKKSLEDFKGTVESHLKEAKSLQDDLNKK